MTTNPTPSNWEELTWQKQIAQILDDELLGRANGKDKMMLALRLAGVVTDLLESKAVEIDDSREIHTHNSIPNDQEVRRATIEEMDKLIEKLIDKCFCPSGFGEDAIYGNARKDTLLEVKLSLTKSLTDNK